METGEKEVERKRAKADPSQRSFPFQYGNVQGKDKESQWPGKAHCEAMTLSSITLGDYGLRTQPVALVTVSLSKVTNYPVF